MSNRRELVAELIEDHGFSANGLLDSIVAWFSEDAMMECLRDLARLEDWRYRFTKTGKLTKLWGTFETGAHDEYTNDFILTAVNDLKAFKLIMDKKSATDISEECEHLFSAVDFDDFDWECADEYFQMKRDGII